MNATLKTSAIVAGDNIVSSLGKKRLEVALAIATCAIGSGGASAAPTPGIEVPKQVVLTASDIAMYTSIWKIYFQEDLSDKNVIEMLAELGLVTVAAAGTAYVVSKVSTAVLCEITDWLGPMGWAVGAAIAGSLTGLFGAAWAVYCDYLFCQKQPQPV
ncbi:hypothetical protein ACF3DV_19525 [Chlorogloeopsis fritschii PCC 9212]|uniref:Uncharacterized protein n=1 Tax=Chlorogloeopsis fritschii PCC 6912 TaxID=211165 RepID=A0A3S0Y3F6_CHLFR|nr:hypothetical protein [Chlorogloeopsis fritschii]RUR84498.1 hypothetical protein PCC6912_13930 [Chlorogloeopsis fritschii PCC 6912]